MFANNEFSVQVRQQKTGALAMLLSHGLELPKDAESALGLWTTCLIAAPSNIALMQSLRDAGLSENGIARPLNGTLQSMCASGDAATIAGLLKFFSSVPVERSSFEQVSTFGDSEVSAAARRFD